MLEELNNKNDFNKLLYQDEVDNKQYIKYYKRIFMVAGIVNYEDEDGIILLNQDTIKSALKSMIDKPIIITHDGTIPVGRVVDCYYDSERASFIAGFIVWNKEAQNLLDNNNYSISCTYAINNYGCGGLYHNIEYNKEAKSIDFKNIAIVKNPRYQEAKEYINSLDNELENGGDGSGNFNHKGRKGKIGGSGKGGKLKTKNKGFFSKIKSNILKKIKGILNNKDVKKKVASKIKSTTSSRKIKEKDIKNKDIKEKDKKNNYKYIDNKEKAVEYATNTFKLNKNELDKIKDIKTINSINETLTSLKDVKNLNIKEIVVAKKRTATTMASMGSNGTLSLSSYYFNNLDNLKNVPYKANVDKKEVLEKLNNYAKYKEEQKFTEIENFVEGSNKKEILDKIKLDYKTFEKDLHNVAFVSGKAEIEGFFNKYKINKTFDLYLKLLSLERSQNNKINYLIKFQNFNYFGNSGTIEEKIKSIINHEMGHNIMFNYANRESLNIEEKEEKRKTLNEVVNLYKKYKNDIIGSVSIYSSFNKDEFFAECYACYKNGREDLLNNEIVDVIKKIEG